MPKLILGLVGLQGCGKGTIADLLQKEYGAHYYRFSAIMGEILDLLAVPKNRENFIKLSETLRHGFSEDVFSYALEKRAVMEAGSVIVIDGIRRLGDIVALEPLPQFKLMAIEVPAKLRFERMKKRGEKVGESEMSWKQFLADEKAPTEATIPLVMKRASIRIKNEGTRKNLETQVRRVMTKLGVHQQA